jgi:hypothetical protein
MTFIPQTVLGTARDYAHLADSEEVTIYRSKIAHAPGERCWIVRTGRYEVTVMPGGGIFEERVLSQGPVHPL